jgi:hypothetical protein
VDRKGVGLRGYRLNLYRRGEIFFITVDAVGLASFCPEFMFLPLVSPDGDELRFWPLSSSPNLCPQMDEFLVGNRGPLSPLVDRLTLDQS